MKASSLLQNKYVNADDLRGRVHCVRIQRVTLEQVGSRDEPKLVLSLEGKSKKVVLNKSNMAAVIDAFGDETDHWRGNEVTLQAAMTQYQGKPVMGVLVTVSDEQRKAFKAAQPEPMETDDDIPF